MTTLYKNANKAELAAFDYLYNLGYEPTKRGWPDFVCYDATGNVFCVEVKPRATSPLKPSQNRLMQALMRFGVPCYRYDPESGLTRLQNETPPAVIPAGSVPE